MKHAVDASLVRAQGRFRNGSVNHNHMKPEARLVKWILVHVPGVTGVGLDEHEHEFSCHSVLKLATASTGRAWQACQCLPSMLS